MESMSYRGDPRQQRLEESGLFHIRTGVNSNEGHGGLPKGAWHSTHSPADKPQVPKAYIPFVVWPAHCGARIFGLQPLQYSPQVPSKLRLGVSVFWIPFCFFCLGVALYSLYLQFGHFVEVVLNPLTSLHNYIEEVPMCLNLVKTVVCMWCSLIGSRRLARCWHTVISILQELDFMNGGVSSLSRRCSPVESWIIFLGIWLNYSVVLATQILFTFAKDYVTTCWDILAFILCRFISISVESQFLVSCVLVHRGYGAIARSMTAVKSSHLPEDLPLGEQKTYAFYENYKGSPFWVDRAHWIRQLRLHHQKVFHALQDLTEYFGIPLLLVIVQIRIQLITDSFIAIKYILKNDVEFLSYYTIEVLFAWYRMFHLIYRSERIIQEDRELRQITYSVDPSTWDSHSQRQLQLFRRQLRALEPQLHTCSVFFLTYDLLLAVAATTTTYLVVLVQSAGRTNGFS